MLNKYIHVQCDEYSLLIDIRWVEEVINITTSIETEAGLELKWRGNRVSFIDLTKILMGHKPKNNKHCIIIKDNDKYLGVGVGQVANIQSIKDDDFEDLPNLDFPFNDYFDKAYMKDSGKQCVYRLRNLVKVKHGAS